jgi:hypothetical protein
MKANEFIKKHGIDEAKKANALSINAGHEDLELKKLIELSKDEFEKGKVIVEREIESLSEENKNQINKVISEIESKNANLVKQVDFFIKESMKCFVIEVWADSYKSIDDAFSYHITSNGEVFFLREQARQLWDYWNKQYRDIEE